MTTEEIERRIKAARILRELSQRDMDAAGFEDGLGRQELSRVERGQLALTRVRRDALCRILGVPQRWFLAEDVDEIVGLGGLLGHLAAQQEADVVADARERLPALFDYATPTERARFEQAVSIIERMNAATAKLADGESVTLTIHRTGDDESESQGEAATPSVADRARRAAQRLDDTPPSPRRTPRAVGDEDEGR